MLSFLRHSPGTNELSETHGAIFVLWIDGVGCYWLCLNERVTIGRPDYSTSAPLRTDRHEEADIAILSDLKRHHATIVRTGEGYVLEAHGPARVAGREVTDRVHLTDGAIVELGRGVRLRFRQPSDLSLSARLDFVSDHRPTKAVDGIVLLADTCLLGSDDSHHIDCLDWSAPVLLVRKGHELLCRSQKPLFVNGKPLLSNQVLQTGDVVTGDELRYRLELLTHIRIEHAD